MYRTSVTKSVSQHFFFKIIMIIFLILQIVEVISARYVATPFGLRLEECVLSVPSGSQVRETERGTVSVTSRAGDFEAFEYEPPKSCHVEKLSVGNYTKDCDEPPCTCDSLPCNNWINNAGYFPPDKREIGGFSSVYTVPKNPTGLSMGGQTLFYFIGAENTDGLPRHGQNGVGRTILQPVLTWAPSNWCRNGTETGWYVRRLLFSHLLSPSEKQNQHHNFYLGACPHGTAVQQTSRFIHHIFST